MFATNLRGIYYATIEAAQRFEPGGSIINISSASTQAPDPELIAYTAIKAAVESMTRGLSEIYGKRGIRINGVRPGYTDSPINADRVNDPSRSAELIQSTALKRWGTPSDVADLVCFLASNEASFITGQTISVDGGFPVRQTA
jgi:3-oxoacyl-[acyl-carrier protein] reductase